MTAPGFDEFDRTNDPLLTPTEVARLLRVNPKTVTRWHKQGKLNAIRTIGGHRRFRTSDVMRAIDQAADRP